jgi:ubiquinone/menaquinone biosynthesis C-methylase UbiE
MKDNNGYVSAEYLAQAAIITQPVKLASYYNLKIQNGDNILDVGCGPGIDVIGIAGLIDSGQIYGVDYDDENIALASKTAEDQGLSHLVNFQTADATNLPFCDNFFDSCRCDRVFQHLTDPDAAMKEIVRVVRPNGTIVISDIDWGSLCIDHPYYYLTNRIIHSMTTSFFNNGYAGRTLYRKFLKHNLTNITIQQFPLYTTNRDMFNMVTNISGVLAYLIDHGELLQTEADLWKAKITEDMFASATITMVSATK